VENRNSLKRYKQLVQKLVALEVKYRHEALLAGQAGLIQASDAARKRANTLAVRLAILDKLYTQNNLYVKS